MGRGAKPVPAGTPKIPGRHVVENSTVRRPHPLRTCNDDTRIEVLSRRFARPTAAPRPVFYAEILSKVQSLLCRRAQLGRVGQLRTDQSGGRADVGRFQAGQFAQNHVGPGPRYHPEKLENGSNQPVSATAPVPIRLPPRPRTFCRRKWDLLDRRPFTSLPAVRSQPSTRTRHSCRAISTAKTMSQIEGNFVGLGR